MGPGVRERSLMGLVGEMGWMEGESCVVLGVRGLGW